MRLFAYYAIHSFINTIKKLFKTWIAIFFLAICLGGLIGGVVATIGSSKEASTANEEVVEEVEEESGPNFFESRGIDKGTFVDFCVSLGFLALVALNVLNAKNSGKMFKPGDIIMLFASPLKPQSVMMFRLMGSIGISILASLYMLFQLPNLILNAHISVWGAVSLIIAFGTTTMVGTLFQVTFYTLSSRKGRNVKDFTKAIAIFYGLIALGYVIYTIIDGGDYFTCAVNYFAGKNTFWVPFWGWTRGFCYFAGTGETLKSIIYLAVLVVASIVLVMVIWRIDCDFYEDAITAAEKQAELLASARDAQKGGVQTRTKERKGKIERGGYAYGFGANVFFYKAMYNRIRFSKLKIFSTTSLIYMGVVALAAYLLRSMADMNPFFIIACILGVMVFYRTLGNPLEEDVTKSFFIMAPEKASSKLFYSLLAGLTITVMDIIVPVVGAAIFFKSNILSVLAWTLFIVSIDFFGTCVGTFINVSVPGEAGQGMKVVVQVMFLYFGLIFSAGAIVAGVLLDKLILFVAIGAVFNILIGFIFFGLIADFLEKGNK